MRRREAYEWRRGEKALIELLRVLRAAWRSARPT